MTLKHLSSHSLSLIFCYLPFSLLVLEARIHQLQSDVVFDVQRAKVQFVQAQASETWAASGKGPKSIPREKTDIPKSGQTVSKGASKSKPSRWMEKLTEEKKNKLRRQERLQQKIQKNVKEKPPAKSKGSKSSSMAPGTAYKTISAVAEKTVPLKGKGRGQTTLSDETSVSTSSAAAAAVAGTAAMPHNVSKLERKQSKHQVPTEEAANDAQSRAQELAEVEELERRLSDQGRQWASSQQPECPLEESEGTDSGDIHLSIRSYLEACVFAGAVERAHRFLLSQHRVRSRRKHLNTDVYNILMRVWAKKVS